MGTEGTTQLRTQVGLLFAVTVLGAVALAGSCAYGHIFLTRKSQELVTSQQAKTQLDTFGEQVRSWLIAVDTIFVESSQTVGALEEIVDLRSEQLVKEGRQLQSTRLLTASAEPLRVVSESVSKARAELAKGLYSGTAFDPRHSSDTRAQIATHTSAIPAAFLSVDQFATEEILAATDELETLRLRWYGGSAAGLLIYLLVSFSTWLRCKRRISGPLSLVLESIRTSIETGDELIVESTGLGEADRCAREFRTITEKLRRTSESMRVLEGETEALLETIPAIMIGLDPSGVIVLWNAAATNKFGLIRNQALGRSINEVPIPWTEDTTPERLLQILETSNPQTLSEITFINTTGDRRVLSLATTPVSYGQRGSGLLVLGTDLTDQRSLEAQVRHSQKLESVGQLAAGIAHEINTPIQYVGHSIHFLHEAFDDMGSVLESYRQVKESIANGGDSAALIEAAEVAEDEADMELLEEEVPGAIERAIEGVNRVAQIVSAMKSFAHPGASDFASADLNDAVRTTLTVANNELRYIANIQQQLGSIPPVECELGDINQVLLNLLVNAAHAIDDMDSESGDKGTITIRTRHVGDRVVIEVSDTGPGIPDDIAESIFDPFFTTKEVGKGTGQGLAIAHSIICEKHGGSLTFESAEGRGTTFRIALPIRQRVAA